MLLVTNGSVIRSGNLQNFVVPLASALSSSLCGWFLEGQGAVPAAWMWAPSLHLEHGASNEKALQFSGNGCVKTLARAIVSFPRGKQEQSLALACEVTSHGRWWKVSAPLTLFWCQKSLLEGCGKVFLVVPFPYPPSGGTVGMNAITLPSMVHLEEGKIGNCG